MRHDIIDVIEAHVQQKRAELERLQQAVAMIPQVQSDLAALERTLAILRGNDTPVQPSSAQSFGVPPEPYPELAQAILREHGTPLTGDQITQIARSKGKAVKRSSLMGGLYRCIKEGKYFKLVAPGTFGLLEWENHSGEHDESLLVPLQEANVQKDSERWIYVAPDSEPRQEGESPQKEDTVMEE
jgi:hypothetical protein